MAIAIVLGMLSLPSFTQTALAEGKEYHIGSGEDYNTLADFRSNIDGVFSLQNGDVIILHGNDSSLSTNLVINVSVTIKSADNEGPYTISPTNMLSDAVIQVTSGNLTLENINIQGNIQGGFPAVGFFNASDHTLTINGNVKVTGGNGGKFSDGSGVEEGNEYGGSAIQVNTGSLTITGDGTGEFTGGVGTSGFTDGPGIDCSDNPLIISGGGDFIFTGGKGMATTQGSGAIAGTFTTSGTPNIFFSGLSGLECEDLNISGGNITARGADVGAIINGSLNIGAGAAMIAEGGDRGISFKGPTIAGTGNLTAKATGQGDPSEGFGVGIYANNPTGMELSLTGNVDCSGPLGGIGATAGTAQLILKDGPAAGNTWVIDGTPEKAFAQFDIPNSFAPFPRANIQFTGALSGGTYDTDVSVFRLPLSTYTLQVINGTDKTNAGPYTAGSQVSLTADAAPSGQVFDYWSSDNGGTFANPSSAGTTFTMPAGNVTVTAHYKSDPTNPSTTINKTTSPKTDDNGSMTPWIILVIASLCGIGAAVLYRNKLDHGDGA